MTNSKISFTSTTKQAPLSPNAVGRCDVLFIGGAVDDRGKTVHSYLSSKAGTIISLGFCEHKFLVNGHESSVKKLAGLLKPRDIVRFESTTLGLAEMLRALQAVKMANISEVEICYVEPGGYANHESPSDGILNPREFELTTNNKFVGLQGFNEEYREDQQAHHVFFLGYESSRLQQAFEQRGEYNKTKYHRFFVIGVPAFSPGWETNVLANHVQILQRLGVTANSIRYCSANNIGEAYYLLWDLYRAVGNESSVFWISPFGTKPHTVATALFLLETKGAAHNSSLFYDHPVRTDERTKLISKYHFVKVTGI